MAPETVAPYPEEELLLVNAAARFVVDVYNKHGDSYRDARETYRDWLNKPAPSRFDNPRTRRYGLDYSPETTAAINEYYGILHNLDKAAEEAGQRVEELILQAVTPLGGIELDLSFDSLHAIALFAPQGTSRQYRLDLDRLKSYELIYFTEEPIFWRWGRKKVQHELKIPVSLA